MSYFKRYLQLVEQRGNSYLAGAISQTGHDVLHNVFRPFSYREHLTFLLVGDIQSGKTSHMFGVMNVAVDEGFGIFVLLTTDNTRLQQQTLGRARKDLPGFCVCGENDYIKFSQNNLKKPVLVVLKKNSRVLRRWKNNFASNHFCRGNPLFIVDDEADAASLNTLVNKGRQSSINKNLAEIRRTASCSIYMQVTGTPQAIFLQRMASDARPRYVCYFEPGERYLGGDFFFGEAGQDCVVITDSSEDSSNVMDGEYPDDTLARALVTHLTTSAQLFLDGGDVCNLLIHPSMKTDIHDKFAQKTMKCLEILNRDIDDTATVELLRRSHGNLQKTKPNMRQFGVIHQFIRDVLSNHKVRVSVANSKSAYTDSKTYDHGINIIIGGNSLSRGITIPKLQTIYYCRTSRSPQADTMWQHSRMFGYDRDPELARIFMPQLLYKLFVDINATNNALVAQMKKGYSADEITMHYPHELRPTRANVIDRKSLNLLAGGVNYFPFHPVNDSIQDLDEMLMPFVDEFNQISLNIMIRILEKVDSLEDDWNRDDFISFIRAYTAENPLSQGIIIVRRDRDISKGTGTLLSPNDRELGDSFDDKIVLTMYKVTGTKGWDGKKIWIPNIKLPKDMVYYSMPA